MKSTITSVVLAIPFLIGKARASLNCTATEAPVTERACEYTACAALETATIGQVLQAACRADCSNEEDIWFKFYNGQFGPGENLAGCNYHGTPFEQTGLPYCYQESAIPSPTACVDRTATPSNTNPPVTPPGPAPTV